MAERRAGVLRRLAPLRSLTTTGRGLALAGGALLGCGLLAGWGFGACRSLTTSSTLTASGTLESDESLLAAQVSGNLTSLPVPEGSSVNEGAVVATIDDRLLQQQISVADVSTGQNLRLQQQDYVLRAPFNGVVTRVPARVGELATPGEVLVAVAPSDHLKLTLYVREADLARVGAGEQLAVAADPFPGRVFTGQVTSINQQAEFTPKNIQTQADRLNLVFGVQAVVANPDGSLKAGMSVDARFELGAVP
jgi:multidrug resistance efflux pump